MTNYCRNKTQNSSDQRESWLLRIIENIFEISLLDLNLEWFSFLDLNFQSSLGRTVQWEIFVSFLSITCSSNICSGYLCWEYSPEWGEGREGEGGRGRYTGQKAASHFSLCLLTHTHLLTTLDIISIFQQKKTCSHFYIFYFCQEFAEKDPSFLGDEMLKWVKGLIKSGT